MRPDRGDPSNDGQVVQDYEPGLPCPRCHEPTLTRLYVSQTSSLGPVLIATLEGCTTCRTGLYAHTPDPCPPTADGWPSWRYLTILTALVLAAAGALILLR